MILKQKAFQKLVNMMKLKENQEKSATSRYRTRMHNTNSVCMERNSPMPQPLDNRAIDITERYNFHSTSTSDPDKLILTRIFVKLQKYAFLKQNNFMRIDELPYHSSLFYQLNFVSSSFS